MKANSTLEPSASRPPAGRPSLHVRPLYTPEEDTQFDALLGEHHYLGESRPVGDFLRVVVELEGEWAGLFTFGSACYALSPRDTRIGWTPTQRAERQKLVVQNRRFCLLGDPGEHPNLASQCLGAVTRELPALWKKRFGYPPLLLETFSDPEASEGTCYKASGWEPAGMSKGYSRHATELYVRNNKPKKLWLKPLRSDAFALLCAAVLPEEYRPGADSNAHGVLPWRSAQVESLFDALRRVPVPRRDNRSYALPSILSTVAMALLSGYRDISSMERSGQRLTPDQRLHLGLPLRKGTKVRKVPGYKVYYTLLKQLDPQAFARVLSDWLSSQQGNLPGAQAMDGKMVGDTVGILCLADAETGVARAMIPMSAKEGEGDRCEMKAAQTLLTTLGDLGGSLVTSDSLHAQLETARAVKESNGEYLFQVKNNQPTLKQRLEAKLPEATPFLRRRKNPVGG